MRRRYSRTVQKWRKPCEFSELSLPEPLAPLLKEALPVRMAKVEEVDDWKDPRGSLKLLTI